MYDEKIAHETEGLKALEANYFKTHYDHEFVLEPASDRPDLIEYVNTILKERDIKFAAKPVEVSQMDLPNITWTHVFYENGLGLNVLYEREGEKPKRAVGFKLTENMAVPAELAEKFKFARMKTKLAGTIRGSFFVIKGEY